MKHAFTFVLLVAAALPAGGQEKQPPQAKMLEWEWVGDTTDAKGFTYRKFRAVCDGTINTAFTTEVARAFCDQVTRHEKYEMLSIAQGGTPQMSAWVKNKDKTYTREYMFKTGGRKGERAPAPKGGTGTEKPAEVPAADLGKGQLKKVARGTETETDAVPVGGEKRPGVRISYTATYTSPPSDAQVKVDGAWLAEKERVYKTAPYGEQRNSPWRGVSAVEWKAVSADKCTIEVVTWVVQVKKPDKP